jgi:hypothetical protein
MWLLFSTALVLSIIYINRHCFKLAEVIGGHPDFILADSCAASASAQGRQWMCANLVAHSYKGAPGITALLNDWSLRGAVSHTEPVLLHFGRA